jgi:membrane-bound lytic murein transglycosylase F
LRRENGLLSGRIKAGFVLCATVALGTCATPPSLLEEVRATGALRVATYSGPNTVYTSRDAEEAGPEYDLLQGFARKLGVRLEIVDVGNPADVVPALVQGKAHLAAAGLTVSPELERWVDFGPAYQQVTQHLVYRAGRRRPRDLAQLRGRRLEVAAGSNYVQTLARAQARNPDLVFTENPHASQGEILDQVARGQLDYTVIKSNAFAIYRSFLPELRVAFNLSEGESVAWAFPKRGDDSLREAATAYFEEIRANGELARILDHYYSHATRVTHVGTRQYTRDVDQVLPTWRPLFEAAGARHGVDWRLLAAIGYQESKWDPAAVSPTGVRGLMMLTEETAAHYGVEDRTDPRQSVEGGARLFAQLMRRLPASIQEPDRTWFALAAYNIGLGHLLDARRITRERGGDWNKWDDVRPGIRLLADPEYAARTRHGYARGGEALAFVNAVRNYHMVLSWLTRTPGDDGIWIQQRSAPPVIQADAGETEAVGNRG